MTFRVFTLLFVGPCAPSTCLPALKACWKASGDPVKKFKMEVMSS